MAENEPQNEQIDQRTAAGRRIKSLLAERKELRSTIGVLQMQLSQAQAHNRQLLSDTRLGPAQIHRKAMEVAAHRAALADTVEHAKKFDEFRGKVSDAMKNDKIPEEAKGVGLPIALVRTLVDHEHGHRVAVHLIKHPAEAQELASLAPHLANARIGEIAATLDAASRRPKVTTQLGPPVDRVSGGTASKDYTSPTANYQAYKAARNRGQI